MFLFDIYTIFIHVQTHLKTPTSRAPKMRSWHHPEGRFHTLTYGTAVAARPTTGWQTPGVLESTPGAKSGESYFGIYRLQVLARKDFIMLRLLLGDSSDFDARWALRTVQYCSPPARWGLLDFMSVACSPPLLSSSCSTATLDAQCSLSDLNHDHPRPVFPAGPQPRPSPPSVPCRTSTTTIHAQCSLPDLNREYPRQVFPAGPHVGRYGTKNVQKKVRKNVRQVCYILLANSRVCGRVTGAMPLLTLQVAR